MAKAETDISNQCQLIGSKLGYVLWKNPRGKFQDKNGRWITCGVGPNGAADQIGFYSMTITPEMVGSKVAVFTAFEIKTPTGDVREDQLRFLESVRSRGGISCVLRDPEELTAPLYSDGCLRMGKE